MTLKSLTFTALSIVFISYTSFTALVEDFSLSLDTVMSIHWGKLMLIDLYLGFIVFGACVYLIEKSVEKSFLWTIPCLFLGNSVSLIYIAYKFLNKEKA